MREINSTTILDNGETFESARQHRLFNSNHKPASFKEVFGDLSDCILTEDLTLTDLNLDSLEGCPAEVRGYINLDGSPALKNLKGISKSTTMFLSCENLKSLESLEGLEGFCFENSDLFDRTLYLSNCPLLADISALSSVSLKDCSSVIIQATNVHIKDMILNFSEKRNRVGNFNFLKSDYSEKDLEKIYSIYQKVDFNKEKFERAMFLL